MKLSCFLILGLFLLQACKNESQPLQRAGKNEIPVEVEIPEVDFESDQKSEKVFEKLETDQGAEKKRKCRNGICPVRRVLFDQKKLWLV